MKLWLERRRQLKARKHKIKMLELEREEQRQQILNNLLYVGNRYITNIELQQQRSISQ